MPQVRLTRHYWRTARRLAPDGSTTADKLAACIASLRCEPVPGPDDRPDFLPPVRVCHARRVVGTALLVLFVRRDDVVDVFSVRVG
jgi:hypothetical protein